MPDKELCCDPSASAADQPPLPQESHLTPEQRAFAEVVGREIARFWSRQSRPNGELGFGRGRDVDVPDS